MYKLSKYLLKVGSIHRKNGKTGRSPKALLVSTLVLGSLYSFPLAQASPCLNYAINPRTGKQECFDSLQKTSSPASPASPASSTSPTSQPSPSKSRGLNQKIYN